MNTIIITKKDNVIKYYWTGEPNYVIDNKHITVYANPIRNIMDLSKRNAEVLHISITAPENWAGNKYKWEHDDFVLNPNYVAPGE